MTPFGESPLRVQHKSQPYFHVFKPEIEKFHNKNTWEENTLKELKEEKTVESSVG